MILDLWHDWERPSFSRHKPRWSLLVPVLALLAIGLSMQFYLGPILAKSLNLPSNYFFVRHLVFCVLGLAVLYLGFKIKLQWILRASSTILIAGLILSLLAIVIGDSSDARWLNFMGLSLQPVEIVKIGLILVGAGYFYKVNSLDQKTFNDFLKANWLILSILALLGVIVLYFQSDYGSMVILISIILTMLFLTGAKLKFFSWILIAAALVAIIFVVIAPYRLSRISVFLNPQEDCLNQGYQICQSLVGIGSGGVTGRGFNDSVQIYGYLPELHNDTVFAGFAEIFGFLGSVFLVLIILLFLLLIYKTALRLENSLMLIVSGFFVWIGLQSVFNIAGVLNIIPLKGITLPLVSYGGSSLVSILFMIGVILQISAYTIRRDEKRNYKTNVGRGRYRRARHAPRRPS